MRRVLGTWQKPTAAQLFVLCMGVAVGLFLFICTTVPIRLTPVKGLGLTEFEFERNDSPRLGDPEESRTTKKVPTLSGTVITTGDEEEYHDWATEYFDDENSQKQDSKGTENTSEGPGEAAETQGELNLTNAPESTIKDANPPTTAITAILKKVVPECAKDLPKPGGFIMIMSSHTGSKHHHT